MSATNQNQTKFTNQKKHLLFYNIWFITTLNNIAWLFGSSLMWSKSYDQVKVKYNVKIYNKINCEKCNDISINCCHFLFKEYSTFNRHMLCNVFLDEYFDKTPAYNKCFCQVCHKSRGDKECYTRGQPPKVYGLPIGWSRFSIK